MARTIFLIFLINKKKHRYLEQSNSINGPVVIIIILISCPLTNFIEICEREKKEENLIMYVIISHGNEQII